MRSPQISIQSMWASRQMIKGLLFESCECSPPLSTHNSHMHLPPADGAQETSESGCCLHSHSSNAIWFSSLMASASRGQMAS